MLGGTFSCNNVSNTGASSNASYIPLYHMTATNVCILSSDEGGGRSSSSKTSSVAIAAAATATAISALWLIHCSHRRKEEFAQARRLVRKKTLSTPDDVVEVVVPFVAVQDKRELSSQSLVTGSSGSSRPIIEANNEEQEVQNDVQVNDVLPLPEVNVTTEQGQNLEVGSDVQTITNEMFTQDNESEHERKEEETMISQKEAQERAENESANKKLSLSLEENKSIEDDEDEDDEGDDIFSISLPPFAMFSPIHKGGRLSTPTSNERGGDTFFWNDSSSICGSDKSLTINGTTDRRDDIESWQQHHQSCDMAFNDNVDENIKGDENRSTSNKIVKPKQKRSCSISLILQQNKHDDYESINFYLPKLNAWCKCDDCRTSILSQAKDHTILDLSNILRSWQVEFLSSQGIHTIDDLLNVKDDMVFLKSDNDSKGESTKKELKQGSTTETNDDTSSLCEAMVTWRVHHSDKQIVKSQFNNAKACSVALHVWKKAAATLRESIYHQLSSSNKEMNWVPDLAVSGKWHNSSFRRQSSNISTTTVILPNDDDDDDDTTLTL